MFDLRIMYVVIAATLLFVAIPFEEASGHSVLEAADPVDGEQLEETIDTIELYFSTKIENGSTLYLTNEEGQELQPSAIDIEDDEMKATFKDVLESGTYRVNWKIIGSDGHLIEDGYSFSILETEDSKIQKGVNQNENNINTETNDADQNNTDYGVGNEPNDQSSGSKNTTGEQTDTVNDRVSLSTVIIILLVVIGTIFAIWLFTDKRKK
ncbi:copper resistance protein CopC [Macrococcoides canis]|uniref:copper resistance CopC family protein n=1 Tax=Macrococcoides canis TaxID=1855823 RepID=UPI0010FC1476|nr:copper resistance protein CopC [Macrococcus canis]QCT75435.1 hypothetical protein EST43_09385 [Macrococcus canis]UTH02032.1 copper resistance protein CopC [Macrococcus canis]